MGSEEVMLATRWVCVCSRTVSVMLFTDPWKSLMTLEGSLAIWYN